MDQDSPISRVERTFWTVWYYITDAVNRFLRPEPTNTVSNDPNSFQQSAVESEPGASGRPEGDTSGGDVDEEHSVATASLLSSSRPVVAWELCTTEIDLGPEKESMQYKSQPSGGSESKASEEGEEIRQEHLSQTGNDDAGLLVDKGAREKNDKEEESGDWNLYTHRQGETPDNYECEEHSKMGSLNRTGDEVIEDIEGRGRKADAKEETQGEITPDDDQETDETTRNIQIKEEADKMHHENEQGLEAEDTETTQRSLTDFSLEDEHNVDIEEARVQRDEADTAVVHEEVENSDGKLQLVVETENKYDEWAKQVENPFLVCEELSENDSNVKGDDPGLISLNDELKMTFKKCGSVSEDVGQEYVMSHESESEKAEAEREEDEREQSGEQNVNETADNQALDEEPEQEEDMKTVTVGGQGTEHDTHTTDIVQNAEAELYATEFTDKGKEDVAEDNEVQTKTRQTSGVGGTVVNENSQVTTTDISVDETFFDKDQVEEERLSFEEDHYKDGYIEAACTTTSITAKPEGETGQEISGEFKNIPLVPCEGQVVVSRELNSATCEETQEGVPEYNNEPGPDENTTQRFLEEGNLKEIQANKLPEEVESNELESLQNGRTEGDSLLVRVRMEEEQESTEDIKEPTGILHLTDPGLLQETEKLLVEPVVEESGHLFEEEDGKLLDSSMKTKIEQSEKEFETHDGVIEETTKELQGGTEELLIEFEMCEGLSDSKDVAGDGCETTGAVAAEESLVGFAEEKFKILEAVTELKLLEDTTVAMQDAEIDVEETGYEIDVEAVEDEMQNKKEREVLNLEVAALAAKNNENIMFTESELSRPDESLETTNQLSVKAFEVSNEMLIDTEAADELMTTETKPKDLALITEEIEAKHVTESEGSCAEEPNSSVSGCQDLIDEEILDLWIQTALSKDTNGMEQEEEGPEPGQQMDTKTEPSSEEQDELPLVQSEKEKEQLVESNAGECGLVSDVEMSSSTAESGFLDQSVSEWDTDHSEIQLLKSNSSGSFQDIHDMLTSTTESTDVSELSTQQPYSESQDILMEETVDMGQSSLTGEESVTETGFYPESGVISSEAEHLNQELEKSQEKTDEERAESAETETGSQKETDADATDPRCTEWKNTEEADVESLAKMRPVFKDEKTKVEDVPLEVTASDFPDEIKQAELGQAGRGSEALLHEEVMLPESQDNTFVESEKSLQWPSLDKPQPEWTEDTDESLPELNRAQVAEQPVTTFEDQSEVDSSALNFTAQRSRIAVKNPRVRPPKDPRSLLHMPSLDPTPSSHLPVKVPAGVPLGGMGIGIKLPGLGAGFPVLKKTQHVVREEKSSEPLSQEPEPKPEEESGTPKQDEAQYKPKWMPPRHPGFGNPLMSELKTKLKKTPKE
ncbi:uncharacterized protein si:ch211-136m16.8 [Toxotes jaculatrix]|uniref:uncharacterized protein si:ch211-136m16.8 n=1 Tax=Toxotes jaculatrix TaxID=941984 RepID=UPI001B3AD0B0|nr:uncharacterized protein si:ch211-136m16.8 [Toxotes jaculatrix]